MNKKVIAVILISVGLFFTFYSAYLIYLRNVKLPVKVDPNVRAENLVPTQIQIPSLALNLNVSTVELKNNQWPVSKDSVLYWQDSPLPGNKGNSVIYGHNWENLFGKLQNVKRNSVVEVTYSNGTHKTFKIVDTYTVTADETHILNNSNDSRITLYTCTGFLDTKRFVAIAIPS